MPDSAKTERRTVHYSGRVQGVGFRYTCNSLAKRHEVTGTVQNLADGRVRLVVEGLISEIEAFCGDIDRAMGGNIIERKVDRRPMTSEFADFRVKY